MVSPASKQCYKSCGVARVDPSTSKSPGGGLFNHQNVFIDCTMSYGEKRLKQKGYFKFLPRNIYKHGCIRYGRQLLLSKNLPLFQDIEDFYYNFSD